MENKIIIIGAGISGLSLAYHLEEMKCRNYLILEAAAKAGGLCGSYELNGFTFDYSGHLLHLSSKQGLRLAQKLLGKNALAHKRRAFVHIYGEDLPYPFQNNLYGLRDAVVSECVKGALTAYKDKKIKDTTLFKNWALALYGEGICKHFMFPYNQKLWQTDLDKMTSAWCGKFIPAGTLEDIIKGAYTRRRKDFGYNAGFLYPKEGGCGAICGGLLKKAGNLHLNSEAKEIDLKEKSVKAGGKKYAYDTLVSTMPLKTLGAIIKNLPPPVKRDFELLKHNSVYVLNLGVSGGTKEGHWYYFPQDKYPFYRAGVQSAFSPALAPQGASGFYIEFAFPGGAVVKEQDLKKMEQQTLKHLLELGFIARDAKILAAGWAQIPCAYPIYDVNYETARKNIIDFLAAQNIYLLGRFGAWEYSFMEKSLLDGAAMAGKLVKA
ncbi:MAG: FAD-dependent oxidoreductase [Elusimicrobiota bacterium]|nr:FAD-dependent oxidoreductase [Elusimicrobiota bacterium]